MARLHVTAWGNPELPDIDEEMDEYPFHLFWQYPVIDVTLLTPISFSDINQRAD